MVNDIIARLREGSIKKVVLFGDSDKMPPTPYVVVKPEFGAISNTRQFRIIAHAQKGDFDKLNDYVLKELDTLLLGGIDDDEGNRYKLYPNGFTDITPEPDDTTYFMERLYYTPMTIRG